MVAATQRGVTVRLLFDHLGSRGIPGHDEMLARLESTDISGTGCCPTCRAMVVQELLSTAGRSGRGADGADTAVTRQG
jgi:hypothetical protein